MLKGLRRNGFLAYRPCFESKCLKPVKQEGFFEQMPQGSHRMPRSWIEQHYNFSDEQGGPLEAQWDKSCGPGVASLESMEDATQHGEPGCKNKLECMKEQHPDGIQEPFVEIVGDIDISEELPQQASGLEEILRNVQNRRRTHIHAQITSQKKAF